MIQLASSCMHDVKDDIKIEWGAVDLPADSVGQPHLGLAGPLVGSVGSKVIIGGGANFPDGKPWEGGHKKYHGDVFVYTWHNQILTYHHTDQLPSPLAYAACYSDNDKIYVVGGENEAGLSKGAYAIGIGADEDLVIDTLPNLPEGISSAGLVCVGHVLYLVGGETEKFTSDQILRLDSKGSNTWENVQQLPHGISNAVVVAVGKDLYIMGGRYRVANEISPFSDRVYLFDTQENTISSLTSLPEPLAAAVGIRYKGVIFFLGGDNAQTYHQVEELLLQAATEQDMTRKDSITQRKNRLQANHPGFSKKQLVYDIGAETWKALEADFPFDMPVTTTAVRLDSNFLMIPSGEIKAGVRTDKIYIGKIIKD
ncbi:hypothetical protein G5B30_07660 [Sphingobacterium sp. SGG-5]|uniref:hypothetical protein n=1 Tax=Sphingobacterium sp. SGG-5 TaxID=2710881 RepID=UPI0013EA2838|nr:hypothetical protein [Sphingobacterium sp. SGG-5]NGM61789.1 hypothetical protein [Sphingobacterium sp. SGG-5]